jgi:signal peptidase II
VAGARIRPVEVVVVAAVLVVDQLAKATMAATLMLGEPRSVIPGFFDLTRIHNTGTAFGLFNAFDFPFKTAVLVVIGLAALAGLGYYLATLPLEQRLSRLGLAMVLGGAIGNLLDRVRLGYVLDFFDFYWAGWHFWAFNVADASITVGVALMLLDMLVPRRAPRHATD